jgi:hypothetical protein
MRFLFRSPLLFLRIVTVFFIYFLQIIAFFGETDKNSRNPIDNPCLFVVKYIYVYTLYTMHKLPQKMILEFRGSQNSLFEKSFCLANPAQFRCFCHNNASGGTTMGHRDKAIEYVWSDKKRTFLGLPLSFTRYFLTEDRLITRCGFLNVKEDELELYRIVDKSLERSLGQRICGLGTIILFCKDADTPEKHIVSVKCPREVSDLIGAYVSQQKDRYSIRGRDMVGSAGCNDEI